MAGGGSSSLWPLLFRWSTWAARRGGGAPFSGELVFSGNGHHSMPLLSSLEFQMASNVPSSLDKMSARYYILLPPFFPVFSFLSFIDDQFLLSFWAKLSAQNGGFTSRIWNTFFYTLLLLRGKKIKIVFVGKKTVVEVMVRIWWQVNRERETTT